MGEPIVDAGHDLDLRIAVELFGVKRLSDADMLTEALAVWERQSNCVYFLMGFTHIDGDGLGARFRQTVPRYSTDIAAAWLVVEHMAARYGAALHLAAYRHENPPPDKAHRATFWSHEMEIETAYAPTTPLAICRAALDAINRGRTPTETGHG